MKILYENSIYEKFNILESLEKVNESMKNITDSSEIKKNHSGLSVFMDFYLNSEPKE